MDDYEKTPAGRRYITILLIFWLAAVASSFTGACLFSIRFPLIGTLFPFRVLLPVTALLTLILCILKKEAPWKDLTRLEIWCLIFCGSLFLYGGVSLFRAIEFTHTFHRFFNLTFDLLFFVLLLYLMKKPFFRKPTVILCYILVFVFFILGLIEIFNGGFFLDKYDTYKRLWIMNRLGQWPAVFSANSNDFAMTLVFLFAVLTMDFYREPARKPGKALAYTFAAGVVYFHSVSTSSRLSRYSFFLIIIVLLIMAVILLRKAHISFLPLLLIFFMLSTQFVTQYHAKILPCYRYLVALRAYEAGGADGEAPTLDILDGESSLIDQFISADEETGDMVLRNDNSAGYRTHLLLHAFRCIKDSRLLGVGLGNTEMLAKARRITGDAGIYATHCFLVRLVSDFGIFALIPLLFIIFHLFKNAFSVFSAARKAHDRRLAALSVLLIGMLFLYPLLSTASSDAQDVSSMWLFLAFLVVSSTQTVKECP